MTRILYCIAVVTFLFSCDENKESPLLALSDYFPLTTKTYYLYDVDETLISQNVNSRTVYEMKMVVADSFQNAEGGYTFVLNRYKRANPSEAWLPIETWSATESGGKLLIKEGNTTFVALNTPLLVSQQWNANAYNTLGGPQNCGADSRPCDLFQIESINAPLNVGNTNYEETLTVIQNNDPDRVTKYDVRKTVYARNVGIVTIEKEVLNYCSFQYCLNKLFVDDGFIYKQSLKQYGKE